MEKFKSEVLALLIGIIALGFCFSVYRLLKNRLTRSCPSVKGSERNVRPVRSTAVTPAAPKPREKVLSHWFHEFISGYRFLGSLFRRLLHRDVLLSAAGDLLVMIAVSIGMALFCAYSDGGSDLYMTTFMTLMYVSAALILFARCVKGSRMIYFPCCILILTGIALAVLLYLSPMQGVRANRIEHPDKTVLFHIIAICFALVAFPLLRMACRLRYRNAMIMILNGLTVLCYLGTLALADSVNGATNWITLGPLSFQSTELTRFLSLITLGLTLTNDLMKERTRFWWASATVGINGIFLLLCNEFGILMVLCLVYLGMLLIFQKGIGKVIALVIAGAVMVTVFGLVGKVCYDRVNPPEIAVEEVTESTAVTQPQEQSTLVKAISQGYAKVFGRFMVFLSPEDAAKLTDTSQWRKSKEALVISDWFGSPYDLSIPVARSDFIFCYLLVRLGVMAGFVVLGLLIMMLLGGTVHCLRNPHTGEAAVGIAFLFSMVIQSLLAAMSATGNFAIVGLPFMFLAYGGTATIVNYCMLVFLVYATGSRDFDADKHRSPKAIR